MRADFGGRVPTHVLSAAEIRNDVVVTIPDIAPFMEFGGGECVTHLYLRRGTLASFAPGDIVGVVTSHAGAEILRVDRDELTRPRADLRTRVRRFVRDREGAPAGLHSLVAYLCRDDPEFCRAPSLPLSELLARYRVSWDGDRVGLDQFDFEKYRNDERIEFLVAAHGMDVDEAAAVATMHNRVRGALGGLGTADLHSDVIRCAAKVESAGAAYGMIAPWLHDEAQRSRILDLLTVSVAQAPHGQAAGVLAWVCGAIAAAEGMTADVIAFAQRCIRELPEWGPGVEFAAEVAVDRGEFDEAQRILTGLPRRKRKDCLPHSVLGALMRELELAPPISEIDTAKGLYSKLLRFTRSDPSARMALIEVAQALRQDSDQVPLPDDSELSGLIADPLVVSCVVVEGGMLHHFLRTRGGLLPSNERALLERWAGVRRRIFVVDAVGTSDNLLALTSLDGDVTRCYVAAELRGKVVQGGSVLAWSVPLLRGASAVFSLCAVPAPAAAVFDELARSSPTPRELLAALQLAQGEAGVLVHDSVAISVP
ncbi:hypothetical protein [Hoyosella subflava]|uniref:Tetratricopeptide repeat family protein n=1 Tax=Hoyosella subflava (strain DSM 45089 / JCM 17490 / NBRC 109087 / DQS3-9A1) TaxID=443218 RepID=F6EP84_HOYSD|nr:hypothetical protein [Hoyosella subflava]AEF41744.1 Tetratricopeptide repeat family protein [Hoyosella subflava DQS3-9A1]